MKEWRSAMHIGWLLLLLSGLVQAQWKSIGPPGGILGGFAQAPSDPNILYAVGQAYPGHLFKSTDHGQTWNRCGPSNSNPYDLVVHPTSSSTVYIDGGYRFYKTTNSGTSWATTDVPSYMLVMKLQPGNPLIIHGAGYDYNSTLGVSQLMYHRSTDGGTTWDTTKITTEYGYPYAVAPDPTNSQIVYLGAYCRIGDPYYGKVYKSTNGGASFEDKTGIIVGTVYDIAHDPTTSGKLYASTGSGIYRTTDGGTNWTRNNGYVTTSEQIRICPTNASVLYAGTAMGKVCKSTDGGINWMETTNGLQGNYSFGLIVENASSVFAVTTAGVFRTTNGGTLWTTQNTGLSCSQMSAIAISPSNPSVVYAGISGDAVYKTTNAGQATVTWSRIPDFYSCTEVADIVVSPTSPDILYALEGGT